MVILLSELLVLLKLLEKLPVRRLKKLETLLQLLSRLPMLELQTLVSTHAAHDVLPPTLQEYAQITLMLDALPIVGINLSAVVLNELLVLHDGVLHEDPRHRLQLRFVLKR
ncbi:hypothetical protein PRIC2_012155 [Phytophthora ramorum]